MQLVKQKEVRELVCSIRSIIIFFILLLLVSTLFNIFPGLTSNAGAGQITLTWDPNTQPDFAGYNVYYGTASGTYSTRLNVGNVTSYTVTNLSDTATYFLAVTAYDTASNESDYSNEVYNLGLDTTAPVISGTTASSITSTSAVITWTTSESSTSQIEYGTTTTYNLSTTIDNSLQTSHSVTLTGLSSWTTYHYRVKSQDASGNLATSSDQTFTTLAPPDTTSPIGTISISNGATYSTATTVSLTLYCSDAGSGCNQMQLSNDGTTWNSWETYATSKSWTLPAGDGTKTVYARYRDNSGNVSSNYSDSITLDSTAPAISGIGTGSLTSTQATITWATQEASSTQVEYGTTTSYGSSSTLNNTPVTSHSVTLSNLSSSSTYHFRVKSSDAAGNLATSSDQTFTTTAPPDTTPPVISGVATGSVTTSGATISWTTNEPATTQAEYGTTSSLGSLSPSDSALVTSHSVILTGLNSNTTYYFKVRSIDGSGNNTLSAQNTFVTLQVALPDTPTAIPDLQVQSGSSTRNSAVVMWTATGADGSVGTASLYDLRMSKLKIIEDNLTPNTGEVTFTNATAVTGVPAPQPSGTSQSIQITGLETNTVYYFAIKAIDNKGNKSPISNVVNAGNLPSLPVTAVRQGYTLISLPLAPVTTDVQALLGNIVGSPVELYWWNSSAGSGAGALVKETNVVPGYGYFLKSDRTNAVLNIAGTAVTDPNRAIPIQPGWNMIGNPYPAEIALRNTQIRNPGTNEVKTFEQAVVAGWVGNAIYSYNGSTYDFAVHSTATLKLWHGYWLAVLGEEMYELIITKP